MTVIEICYNLANAVVGIAFIPQILTLIRTPSADDKSLNLTTTTLFLMCSIAMLAYAAVQVQDVYFAASGLVNVTGWLLVTSLGTYNRYLRRGRIRSDDFSI